MNHKMFKLSVISSALLATTQVSAALYNIVEVTPSTSYSYESAYGVAIEPAVTSGPGDNCFASSTAGSKSCNSYTLAGETRLAPMNSGLAVDGLSYREEAPFAMDNRFIYIQSESEFVDYCEEELRYSTCGAWANTRWNIFSREKTDTTPNSIAFTGSSTTGSPIDETLNIVINSISPSGTPIGIDSQPANFTGDVRASVVARSEGVDPVANSSQTRAWAANTDYTVGSIANTYGSFYTSKAAIWKNSDGTTVEIPWDSGTADTSDRLAQGSIRDFVVDSNNNMIYAVGFNSYHESSFNYMNATIFSAPLSFTSDSDWTGKAVSNARAIIDGDRVHSNSVVTSINKNLVAIGSAKRAGDNPYAGSAANRLFVIPDVSADSISATFPSGGILFNGAGGKAGAINNYNEIVGQIDFESTREIDGKARRKRGFIYPYSGKGTDSTRSAIFNNQAWYLDDLTNDGSTSGNNQYRVIDATDINDAGVISGTAWKCDGGYSTTAHNSTCSGTETTVAVKLVPIAGATASDITVRGTDENSLGERSGGSMGLWGFVLLGLAWFRRK